MKRGNIDNKPGLVILVDYRCLLHPREEPTVLNRLKRWLRRHIPSLSRYSYLLPTYNYTVRPTALPFLRHAARCGLDVDVWFPDGVPDTGVSKMPVRQVRRSSLYYAVSRIEVDGYATFVTTEDRLVEPDGRVQVYTGVSHNFSGVTR